MNSVMSSTSAADIAIGEKRIKEKKLNFKLCYYDKSIH